MKRFKIVLSNIVILCMTISISCKKMIEVDGPPTSINEENVFKNDATAIALITGVYINMSNDNIDFLNGTSRITFYPALSADELSVSSNSISDEVIGFYQNNIKSDQISINFYEKSYKAIYTVNAALDGLTKSASITQAVKNQLLGEAYFIRAFYYFNLTNMFGGVPLIVNTDYSQTLSLSKASVSDVYAQIRADLMTAQGLLNPEYLTGSLLQNTTERVRPNKFTATALLARLYLYMKEYANAEVEATKVIDHKVFYDTIPLSEMFQKNSKETIWAIQPVGIDANRNTGEGMLWLIPETGFDGTRLYYLDKEFLKVFETGDLRRKIWIDSILLQGTYYKFSAKYKVGQVNTPTVEYPIILRLAEQYLIRAEARIQQDKVAEGIADLNVLRMRSTDAAAPIDQQLKRLQTSISKDAAITYVLHERQVELFTEWGHRWLDLRRSGTIDAVMAAAAVRKGGIWNSNKALYPFPFTQLQSNSNLVQNPGY
jgi:starch-binding outer membrane protein, SusD/RagB family